MSEQEMSVPVSAERLLAAFLKSFGRFEITLETLMADYSNYQIAVNQEREGYVFFELVEATDEES